MVCYLLFSRGVTFFRGNYEIKLALRYRTNRGEQGKKLYFDGETKQNLYCLEL